RVFGRGTPVPSSICANRPLSVMSEITSADEVLAGNRSLKDSGSSETAFAQSSEHPISTALGRGKCSKYSGSSAHVGVCFNVSGTRRYHRDLPGRSLGSQTE